MADNNWKNKSLGMSNAHSSESSSDEGDVIVMLQTNNEFGDTIYCYLKLPFDDFLKVKDFVSNKQSFNPRDYGEIVAAGQGDPSPDTIKELEEEYGFKPIAIADPNPLPDRFVVEDMDDDDYP